MKRNTKKQKQNWAIISQSQQEHNQLISVRTGQQWPILARIKPQQQRKTTC